jgi:Flp pilus assembly protein TadG
MAGRMNSKLISHNDRKERGAALLEIAFVLPLMLTLLLGLVSSGIALNRSNSLNNAARESARFGATLPAENLTFWLNKVADVAIDSATGDLDNGTDGRYVCVAYVYPAGSVPSSGDDDPVYTVGEDHTVRLVVNSEGVKSVAAGKSCYTDGRPHDERRVQVFVERATDFNLLFWDRVVTLDGQSTARYERIE